MSNNEVTTYTFTPEQIDVLAKHAWLVLDAAVWSEYVTGEEVNAARSALRRIVEQAKACA